MGQYWIDSGQIEPGQEADDAVEHEWRVLLQSIQQ